MPKAMQWTLAPSNTTTSKSIDLDNPSDCASESVEPVLRAVPLSVVSDRWELFIRCIRNRSRAAFRRLENLLPIRRFQGRPEHSFLALGVGNIDELLADGFVGRPEAFFADQLK
jgi:hypothetical protein